VVSAVEEKIFDREIFMKTIGTKKEFCELF
jgi:hypothetical protein